LLDHFRKAGDKFKARPGTYLLIPCVAAIVGWFTNWLAVQMIFYPIKFRGIPLWVRDEIPLGLLGWQGIVVSLIDGGAAVFFQSLMMFAGTYQCLALAL
jgi:hypothetical protein